MATFLTALNDGCATCAAIFDKGSDKCHGLDTATIVFIVLGVLLVGVLVIVILKVRKKNRKKGDKYYTIIEDQDVEQQINTLKF